MRKWLNLFVVAAVCMLAVPAHGDTVFTTTLSGDQERPTPVVSPGSGTAELTLSTDMLTLSVEVLFADLTGITTDAHIHCCIGPEAATGVAVGFTGAGFPLGVTSGSFSGTFDLTDPLIYGASFLGGGTAEDARNKLIQGFNSSMAYVNVHSTFSPPGEIRGQIIPEPSSMSLIGLGVVGVLALGVRRRRRAS